MSTIQSIICATALVVLGGCAGSTEPSSDSSGEPAEHGFVVTKEKPGLPELTDSDLREIAAIAAKANPGTAVREIEHREGMMRGYYYVVVAYDFHDTRGRIRNYRTTVVSAPDKDRPPERRRNPDPTHWHRSPDAALEVMTQVCPAGQSFAGENPVSEDRVLTLKVDPKIDDERLLEIVDYMKGRHANDERLRWIEMKDGKLEVRTTRGGEGTVFAVEKVDGKWTHRQSGGWME